MFHAHGRTDEWTYVPRCTGRGEVNGDRSSKISVFTYKTARCHNPAEKDRRTSKLEIILCTSFCEPFAAVPTFQQLIWCFVKTIKVTAISQSQTKHRKKNRAQVTVSNDVSLWVYLTAGRRMCSGHVMNEEKTPRNPRDYICLLSAYSTQVCW